MSADIEHNITFNYMYQSILQVYIHIHKVVSLSLVPRALITDYTEMTHTTNHRFKTKYWTMNLSGSHLYFVVVAAPANNFIRLISYYGYTIVVTLCRSRECQYDKRVVKYLADSLMSKVVSSHAEESLR